MKKFFHHGHIFVIFSLIFTFVACSDNDTTSSSADATGNTKNNGSTESTDSSFADKYSSPTSGYVTWYDGADASSVAYYVPEIESGWYHCAVSEPKYNDLPAGTAIELTANGKTVHLLVTDLCPSADNAEHTSNANYFFDLEKTAFTSLADATVGELQMSFKTIPYPTAKNIKIQVKDGTNDWWLAFRFYNMRDPLKKVEFSQDGSNFTEVGKLDGIKNNWYVIPSGQNLLSGAHYFRLTDIHDQTLTTENLGTFAGNGTYDTGKNFQN